MNRPTRSPRQTRRGAAALTALAVSAAGLAVLGMSPAPATAAAAPIDIQDATFTWDLNHEATAGAFAPGTWNLMSAGKIGDPGQGGATLVTADNGATWNNGEAAGWANRAGSVLVEDLQADGSYAPASFAGTRTNSQGVNSSPFGNALRGETRFVFSQGVGTADPETGTANIAWEGDATLLFYSGMTFFYLSDPELSVAADGTGTVTATAGGYATSMDDPDQWDALPDTEVTVATLTGVEIGEEGIEATPAYREVVYTPTADQSAQVRSGENWGAFPQSFVDFQQTVGQGPYWYSTGGTADPRKVANPFSVEYTQAPTVTVSRTEFLPNGSYVATVEGAGFDPAAVTGTRPPLAGRSGGVYIVFGKFAETWQPSAGAPGSSRVNSSQKWAVRAEDMATIGGAAAGAVELTPQGTFATEVVVDKAAIDARATAENLVNYGIYTYPGSGAVNAAFETFTPVTFAQATPTVSVSAAQRRFGQVATATVRVDSEGGDAGAVTLSRGSTVIGTADLTDGAASFALGRLSAGRYPLTASFAGNANTLPGEAAGTLQVLAATTTTRITMVRPTPRKAGSTTIRVVSPTTTPSGAVRVFLRRADGRLLATKEGALKAGARDFSLPQLARGNYRLVARFPGNANVAGSTQTKGFFVAR